MGKTNLIPPFAFINRGKFEKNTKDD